MAKDQPSANLLFVPASRKPVILKIWPEILGYIPGLVRIKDRTRGLRKIPKVVIDFNSVRRIDAVGATVLMLRLKRFLENVSQFELQVGVGQKTAAELEEYGLIDRLRTAVGTPQQLPLLPENSSRNRRKVFWLEYSKYSDRRDALVGFKQWLIEYLQPAAESHGIHLRQLIAILAEIAKNSADHTEGDAICGLEIDMLPNGTIKLSFAFGDLGMGIKKHIEANLPPELSKRRPKLGLYEAYYFALKPGYTSRPGTGRNKGVGMSLITDGARAINLNLSVFDAESRGLLSSLNKLSHRDVRSVFHSVGHDVGFFYYGEINVSSLKP